MSTGEEELRPAGDGTKLPDDQLVVIERMMIENIVFLKLSGVPNEVVVHGILSHHNIRI